MTFTCVEAATIITVCVAAKASAVRHSATDVCSAAIWSNEKLDRDLRGNFINCSLNFFSGICWCRW